MTVAYLCVRMLIMKYAEVEVNKRFTIAVNEKEHKAFQIKCVREGRAMSEVLRELMREYTARKKQ